MEIFIEALLITIIASIVSLSFSKLAIGEWWYPELPWKIIGIIFCLLAIGLNFLYFAIIKV